MSCPLPLDDFHRGLGAAMGPFQGFDAPAHYGDEARELEALRQGAGLVDRSWLDRLTMSGADRRRFLGGLVTCEVKDLDPGQGVYGFVTDIKGRILADLAILASEEALILTLPPGLDATIEAHLLRYRIADRVDVTVVDRPVTVTFCGPAAEAALAATIASPLPSAPWQHRTVEVAGVAGRLTRDPRYGRVPAWSLWIDGNDAHLAVASLLDAGRPHGLVPVGWQAAEVLRIEEGRPRFGQDYDGGNFPQETGLEEETVSYSKGCFLGQEIVARIHYRGGVQRRLVGLRFGDNGEDAVGKDLLLDDRKVGTVSSWIRSPGSEVIGLAVVHRRAADGARVRVEDGQTAVVHPLSAGTA